MKLLKTISEEKKQELSGIVWVAVTLLIAVSLFSPSPNKNLLGIIGVTLNNTLLELFGCTSIFIPIVTGSIAIINLFHKTLEKIHLKTLGLLLLFISILTLFGLFSSGFISGGLAGKFLADNLQGLIGRIGSYIVSFLGIIASLYLLEIEEIIFKKGISVKNFILKGFNSLINFLKSKKKNKVLKTEQYPAAYIRQQAEPAEVKPEKRQIFAPIFKENKKEKTEEKKEKKLKPEKSKEIKEKQTASSPAVSFEVPPLSLLADINVKKFSEAGESREIAGMLEETLKDFGVEAKVIDVVHGPVITRYEIQTSAGTKISRITSLSNELSLALRVNQIRIAPIPGKSAVGIEVPNRKWNIVPIKELFESPSWKDTKAMLPLAVGNEIDGTPIITDLSEMPHLLIAGATGSGKSVCINAIIVSLIYKLSPAEVKLLLIDPKRVELLIYSGIPHLYAPLINDPKQASDMLRRLTKDMEERYKKLASCKVRDIREYNKRGGEKLPYIVVVIDELADLMLIAAREVEEAITRLAQLARGVGIHLVLATQRPSVDIITGVIKANLPTRIAFQVASKVDSRTILDMNGAESLLGKGDMLFLPPGAAKPVRGQGSFVSMSDIESTVEFLKQQGGPQYEESMTAQNVYDGMKEDEEDNELFKNALLLVKERKKASVMLIQGSLRISGPRATNLVDLLEAKGFIGPSQGSKPRDVYLDRIEEALKKINA